MPTENQDENRGKQFIVGAVILVLFFTFTCALLFLWRYIPGFLGEAVGTFAGVVSTPFFMEFSVIVSGFVIVIALNAYRRRKSGDEMVEFDQSELPEKFRDKE